MITQVDNLKFSQPKRLIWLKILFNELVWSFINFNNQIDQILQFQILNWWFTPIKMLELANTINYQRATYIFIIKGSLPHFNPWSALWNLDRFQTMVDNIHDNTELILHLLFRKYTSSFDLFHPESDELNLFKIKVKGTSARKNMKYPLILTHQWIAMHSVS